MTSRFDAFTIFWLTGVAGIGLAHLVWGVYELKRGEARWGWMGAQYTRAEEPFYYWMAVIGHFGTVFAACFMFWFGLGVLG